MSDLGDLSTELRTDIIDILFEHSYLRNIGYIPDDLSAFNIDDCIRVYKRMRYEALLKPSLAQSWLEDIDGKLVKYEQLLIEDTLLK